jgi:hypothetical protein
MDNSDEEVTRIDDKAGHPENPEAGRIANIV